MINGLENYFRQIEFVVGLAFGDLSNPQSVDKTATEVKASKTGNTIVLKQSKITYEIA